MSDVEELLGERSRAACWETGQFPCAQTAGGTPPGFVSSRLIVEHVPYDQNMRGFSSTIVLGATLSMRNLIKMRVYSFQKLT